MLDTVGSCYSALDSTTTLETLFGAVTGSPSAFFAPGYLHEGTGDERVGQDGWSILQAVCGAVLEELDCDEQAPLGTSVQDLFERGRTQSVHLTLPNDYSSTS